MKLDKIYVLHLAADKEREEYIKKEFAKIGLDYSIWWNTQRPFDVDIVNSLYRQSLQTNWYRQELAGREHLYANVYNCTMGHYNCIKQAYERGFENIMICEDDIAFLADKEQLEAILDKIPQDYSVAQLAYHSTAQTNYPDFNGDMNEVTFLLSEDSTRAGTMCYVVSRKGMEEYVKVINQSVVPADTAFSHMLKKMSSKIYFLKNKCVSHIGSTSRIAEKTY